MLVIHQESLHYARSAKCKILIGLLIPAVLQLGARLFVTTCSSLVISIISVPQFILLWFLCCGILGNWLNVPDTYTVQQGPSYFNRGHPPSECTRPTVHAGRYKSQMQPCAHYTCTWIIKTASNPLNTEINPSPICWHY